MIAPPDYANMPEKHCFAPCPPGHHCECRERRRALAFREGRLPSPLDDDERPLKNEKKY
jgi:hypothetical protein